jgi:hypothetical protein
MLHRFRQPMLGPLAQLIAGKIAQDDGPEAGIGFAEDALSRAFAKQVTLISPMHPTAPVGKRFEESTLPTPGQRVMYLFGRRGLTFNGRLPELTMAG